MAKSLLVRETLKKDTGKGNYGTVKKVLHKPTNVAMAMKEIQGIWEKRFASADLNWKFRAFVCYMYLTVIVFRCLPHDDPPPRPTVLPRPK